MEIGKENLEDPEDHDMTEPQGSVETFLEKDSHKRKPAWPQELIREVKRYGASKGIRRERKRAKDYNSLLNFHMLS